MGLTVTTLPGRNSQSAIRVAPYLCDGAETVRGREERRELEGWTYQKPKAYPLNMTKNSRPVAIPVSSPFFIPTSFALLSNDSYLLASFSSPPNATTVRTLPSVSSAIAPADAYAFCSLTVKEATIYWGEKRGR